MQGKPMSDYWFEQFLSEDKLMGSKCTECGTLFAPPRPICMKCRSDKMEWTEMKGTGSLAAFTCIHMAPPSMLEEGYGRDNPYCTGAITLDEGPRVVARIEEVDALNPESIPIGMRLEAKFLHRGTDKNLKTVLAFGPRQRRLQKQRRTKNTGE